MGDKPLVVLCDYCSQPATPTTGDKVYPQRTDLAHNKFYVCEPCDARVGCHAGSWRPLGRMANVELRCLKMAAHEAFDPLWRSGQRKRADTYKWLAEQLGLPLARCHIGLFDEAQCRRVLELCRAKRYDL